jgi:hypothetical protein
MNPMEQQQVIRAQAKPGAGKPSGAMNSVFDTGAPPSASARRYLKVNPAAVVIKSGVPIPEVRVDAQSLWQGVYSRMKKGDMAELSEREAKSLISWGKRNKHKLTTRRLGEDCVGVWRLD